MTVTTMKLPFVTSQTDIRCGVWTTFKWVHHPKIVDHFEPARWQVIFETRKCFIFNNKSYFCDKAWLLMSIHHFPQIVWSSNCYITISFHKNMPGLFSWHMLKTGDFTTESHRNEQNVPTWSKNFSESVLLRDWSIFDLQWLVPTSTADIIKVHLLSANIR